MFKRLFWLMIGATLGFGGSWWITRTVKQKLERYLPAKLGAGVANAAQAGTAHVRAAVADGRQAMHQREAELRAQLESRWTGGEPPVTPVARR
jgi:hypothetical protein